MHRRLLPLLLVALFACAGGRGPGEPSEAEHAAYSGALATLARDPAAGTRALGAFVLAYPRSALADDAALRLANLALESGDQSEAARRLRWVIRIHPLGDQSDAARLALARLLRQAGEPDKAWESLRGLRISLLAQRDRRAAHRLLADLAQERGEATDSLRWLAHALSDAQNEAEAARVEAEIDQVLALASLDDLERVVRDLKRRFPAARVQLRLSELYLVEGDLDAAERALRRALGLPLTPDEAERLAALERRIERKSFEGDGMLILPTASAERLPDPRRARGTLGVVLPLSGHLASVGRRSLEGMLLAAGLFGADDRSTIDGAALQGMNRAEAGVRLAVRDTGGTPEGAAKAVYDLAERESVVGILGPLLTDESRGAAEAAESSRIPLVTLSRREEVALQHSQVLRLGTTARAQAVRLADYALHAVDATRVAILYPKDGYGLAMRTAFWEATEARGARVVAIASYEPDANDFAQPIRQLVGFALLTPGEKAVIQERDDMLRRAKRLPLDSARELRDEAAGVTFPNGRPLPPRVDFDVLFIPDTYEKIVLIAPQLAFHDVRGIQLLGPSSWSHPDLVKIGRKHVNGAVFAAPYNPAANTPRAAEFTRRYRREFGSDPGRLAAEAYDATHLVMMELVRGAASREELRRGLLRVNGVPGASGVTSIRADGNALKRPFLFRIRRGEVTPLD